MDTQKPAQANSDKQQFASVADFYPYYLGEHANRTSRRLHLIGSSMALVLFVYGCISWQWQPVLAGFIVGYSFAWLGHFFFEKNKPATFKYPLYSFCCDWIMYKDILTGKIPF